VPIALATLIAAVGLRAAVGKEVVIPLHAERGPHGDPRLGIDVGIGPRTVRVLLSTATPGLRVIATAVPPGAVERTGAPAGETPIDGLVLHGERARARLAFAGAGEPVPAWIDVVDGGTPETFGGLFPGILGIGNVAPPADACCPNPFDSFGFYRQRYLVHAVLAAPSITLDPDENALRGFRFVDVIGAETPIGCVRISGAVSNEVCGAMVFETAVPQLTVTTTGPLVRTPLPPGTTATLTAGPWSRTYAIGPGTGLRLVVRSGSENRIVVGLEALQSVDLFYDVTNERIGLRSVDAGIAPAGKRRSPFPALIGRWRCRASEWPYPIVVRTFAADGTYTQTPLLAGLATAAGFPYVRLGDGELALQHGTESLWEREVFSLRGDALELRNGGYWHESHWTAYPSAESYRCTRTRIGLEPPRRPAAESGRALLHA
jgi:hypothetical protein